MTNRLAETAAEAWDAIYASGRAMRTWPSEDVIRFCARRLSHRRLSSAYTGGEYPEPYRYLRVLEAGCGNGANLWFLQYQGYEVIGVDSSQEALDAAEVLAGHHWPTMKPQLRRLSLGALVGGDLGTFDAIIDCRASQHTPWSQHAAIYGEYYALLKPGGWLFLLHLDNQTTDAKQTHGDGDGIDEQTWANIATPAVYPDNGLVCMPTSAELHSELERAGFLVCRAEILMRKTIQMADIWQEMVASHTAIDAQRPERGV